MFGVFDRSTAIPCNMDVPVGFFLIDAEAKAKAKANGHPEDWRRYQLGVALL